MFGSTRNESERHDPADALVREVGVQLRKARIARGEEIEDVAENLRIRPSYLFGLEQGDLSVMPGRTYALGFLRSYAQYLGFDGDDLIVQIRSSVADLTGKAHLHGRTPLSESGLPKLPILVVSLAALAGIYAGWAYVDGSGQAEIELVAEVPDDLQQEAVTPSEAVSSPAAVRETPRPEAAPADITPAIAPLAEPEADASDLQEVFPNASARAPTVLPSIASGSAAAPPADLANAPPRATQDRTAGSAPIDVATAALEPGAGAQPASSAPAVTVRPAPDAAQAAPTLPGPPPSGQEPPEGSSMRGAAEVLAGLAPVATDAAAPTIYRTDAAAARVILRARSSAWVHVSSTNNDYLWVKTLQPGDAFLVPDRPDLVLWTGNAGGIEVIVDGAPLPPLGPEARVVRDVSLQPQALLRRLAPAPAAGAASSP
jgi:cytoskeleton protein RodZ